MALDTPGYLSRLQRLRAGGQVQNPALTALNTGVSQAGQGDYVFHATNTGNQNAQVSALNTAQKPQMQTPSWNTYGADQEVPGMPGYYFHGNAAPTTGPGANSLQTNPNERNIWTIDSLGTRQNPVPLSYADWIKKQSSNTPLPFEKTYNPWQSLRW